MVKRNLFAKFLLLLPVVLLVSFSIHLWIVSSSGLPLFEHLIVDSYIINALLAIGIFGSLYIFRRMAKDRIGFLFMGGSFLKFIIFFLFFYPTYQNDGTINNQEFAAFFVPYAVALFLETWFTVKLLKNLEKLDEKSSSQLS